MKLGGKSLGSLVLRGLTPLLDTLFILLFALLALSDTRQVEEAEEVRIQLPAVEPGEGTPQDPTELFSVFVDAESGLHLESPQAASEPLATLDELDAALASRLGAVLPEEVAIEIVGDAEARHGVMVELLQHLRLRGFLRVQLLATRSQPEGLQREEPR